MSLQLTYHGNETDFSHQHRLRRGFSNQLRYGLGLAMFFAGVVAMGSARSQEVGVPDASRAVDPETGTGLTPPPINPLAPPPIMVETATPKDPGQADLDEAVAKRIDAKTNFELESVAALIESAITKGLSEENLSFAKKMLGSIQFQRGGGLAGLIPRTRGRRQVQLRDQALEALEESVKHDPTLVEAHLLIARLNLLGDGDPSAIQKATSAAIELLQDQPKELSGAYFLRAMTREDDGPKRKDLDAAIEAYPENTDALRERALLLLRQGDVDESVADLRRALEIDPTNLQNANVAVQQLVDSDRAEDAVDLLSETIRKRPSEGLYRLRAILYRMVDKEEEAFADLNKALAMQPKDPVALLQRAEISLSRDEVKEAKRDYSSALEIAPQIKEMEQGIVVRCLIAVAEGRTADAITGMKVLIERNPGDIFRQLQLANLYLSDDRPRQAIEMLSGVLKQQPDNTDVLRSRGDAYLAVGDHGPAIADYEAALKVLESDDENPSLPGILNNLAWVLATSPKEEVRDGERSIELGRRAVDLTESSEAHILSTLAAGYAETGDFENAIKYSDQAVTLGREEENSQLEQLEEELESYKRGEPWREEQDTEENEMPLISPEDLIDT
ncbi:MAG: tetratricopeptide repeat protein [Planctomycetota bacterium]